MRMATVVLPVPGRPVNDMCRGGGSRCEADARAACRSAEVRDLADARLDGNEPDQLAIELSEDLADLRIAIRRSEVETGSVRPGTAVAGTLASRHRSLSW
jgi:hypothetical protein